MPDADELTAPERVLVIGFAWSPASHDVKDFLARSRVPYRWLDFEQSEEARQRVQALDHGPSDLPLVLFPDGSHLTSPSDEELAERVGLSTEADSPFYDLVIVGGGPAGLAAAVYGASEGVRTIVLERDAPGGQAGTSAAIENYLGFPEGLSGGELARRGVEQAERFGAEVVVTREVTQLRAEDPFRVVVLADGSEIFCHAVLLAVGVSWRVLEAPGCQQLIGRGIYYGAAAAEAPACRGEEVYLLGAGNSAGQAAMLLARYARSVTLVAPEDEFAASMSEYLLERLESMDNVHFRTASKVVSASGDGALESITIENVDTGEQETVPTHRLFVFIGSAPETGWLEGTVQRDEKGFVLAGDRVARDGELCWPLRREPYLLETSLPGVFACGDARAGSVKRVGAAVGEGSMTIQFVHAYLRER